MISVEKVTLRQTVSKYLIVTERSEKFSPNAVAVFFKRFYSSLGLVDCSSHLGGRSYVTRCARKVSQIGGSLMDVTSLIGHKQMLLVQRYIETDPEAQKKLVNTLYSI